MAYRDSSSKGRILIAIAPVRTAPASMKQQYTRRKLKLLIVIICGGIVCGALLMLLAVPIHVHSTADPLAATDRKLLLSKDGWQGKMTTLSSKPRAYYLRNFLSDEECEYLIRVASPTMQESMVVDHKTGGTKRSASRTSTGTFLTREPDAVLQAIEKRVAEVTMLPVENQEAFYVLHYHDGQKYEPHLDFFSNKEFARPEGGGQRVATVLMYLSTPDEGGETVFPDTTEKVTGPGWSECAQQGLAVKAKKRDALVFWSLHPDGTLDPASLHGSCPTLKGNKWTATKWIHVLPYRPGGAIDDDDADGCTDGRESCGHWAAKGECDKNSGFMRKHCKYSCGLCKPATI